MSLKKEPSKESEKRALSLVKYRWVCFLACYFVCFLNVQLSASVCLPKEELHEARTLPAFSQHHRNKHNANRKSAVLSDE